MKYWFVVVRGLGGPHADYCSYSYQVQKETAPEALTEALKHFRQDDDETGRVWNERFSNWRPHEFYDATIREGKTIVKLI